jgi:hypothetical protein
LQGDGTDRVVAYYRGILEHQGAVFLSRVRLLFALGMRDVTTAFKFQVEYYSLITTVVFSQGSMASSCFIDNDYTSYDLLCPDTNPQYYFLPV